MRMAFLSSFWMALESDQQAGQVDSQTRANTLLGEDRRMPVWSGMEGFAFEEKLDHPHFESQPLADPQQALRSNT